MSLPNGWKKIKLGEICNKIGSGSTPKGGREVYLNAGIPIIRSQNVLNGFLDLNDVAFISDEQHSKMKGTWVHPNDILLNITGASIGRSCVVPATVKTANVNQHVCIIRLKECADACYVCNLILSKDVQKQIELLSVGGGRQGLNFQQIASFSFLLPPIEEQKKIAATLSVWDSAIEKMEKLIDAKESLLTEYGKELFGRTEQRQNENWSTIALSDVLNEHGDKSTGKEEVFSVSVHKGLVNQIEHLGRSFAAKDTSNYNRVHYGDIVYTKSPTGDFPLGIVKQSLVKEDVIVSPLYGVFTPKTFELGAILDFYFSSPINANNYLHPVAQKGAKNTINITNKKFLSAKLRLPIDIKEQKKIAQFVQTTKKEMAVLQEILENYKKQKQGLMQKLLIGQWRVK
ncbi:restriction endonuclease subunit S [Fibrobacter sp. UBA4297]|uniref:restriction endonuclease subunit S n=1 Tax=Fibrobacter sp. UBA4297 TaxID=1946536 RepID=UPI0025BAC745|nr:restriction endonuclease subunit S [Fibrobacter sp. UBA4297]